MASYQTIMRGGFTISTNDFIAEIAPMAVTDMMQSNVLASITVAQSMLESADGNHAPCNNLFGVKSTIPGTGQLCWTQEYSNGKWIQIQDWFRVYPDFSGSIADHSTFLTVNGRYTLAGFFIACNNLDYIAAAHALQAAGYATDPHYAQSLINLIEQYGLDQYDREAVSNLQKLIEMDNRITALENLLKKTAPPTWFVTEFGAHALDGIVLDMTGDEDFWRDVAVNLRLAKAKVKNQQT